MLIFVSPLESPLNHLRHSDKKKNTVGFFTHDVMASKTEMLLYHSVFLINAIFILYRKKCSSSLLKKWTFAVCSETFAGEVLHYCLHYFLCLADVYSWNGAG